MNYILNGKVVLVGYNNLKNDMSNLKEKEYTEDKLYEDLCEEGFEEEEDLDKKKKKVFH